MSHLADVAANFWNELFSRSSGPFAARFFIQPATASLLAIRDGCRDAREGRTPYLWTIVHDGVHRWGRLKEGLHAVARVLLLGVILDGLYQYFVLKAFRPLEMVNIVLLLAFVPYLIVRGPAARIARRWRGRFSDGTEASGHG